jgi:hypothetical protein
MRRLSTSSSLSSSSSDIDIASYNALIMTQNYMLEQEIRKKLQEYFDKYNKYKNMPVESVSKKDISVEDVPLEKKPDIPSDSEHEDSSNSESIDIRDNFNLRALTEYLKTHNNTFRTNVEQQTYFFTLYTIFSNLYTDSNGDAIDLKTQDIKNFAQTLSMTYNYSQEHKFREIIDKLKDINAKFILIVKDKITDMLNLLENYLLQHIKKQQHSSNSQECKSAVDEYTNYVKLVILNNVLDNNARDRSINDTIRSYYDWRDGTHYLDESISI